MKHEKLTDKQIRQLKESMQLIVTLASVINLEWHEIAPDFIKTQTGQIKQRCKRIIEDGEAIKKVCYTLVYSTESQEHMDFEFAFELQRLNKFFSTVEYNTLKEFNDKNEELEKVLL